MIVFADLPHHLFVDWAWARFTGFACVPQSISYGESDRPRPFYAPLPLLFNLPSTHFVAALDPPFRCNLLQKAILAQHGRERFDALLQSRSDALFLILASMGIATGARAREAECLWALLDQPEDCKSQLSILVIRSIKSYNKAAIKMGLVSCEAMRAIVRCEATDKFTGL